MPGDTYRIDRAWLDENKACQEARDIFKETYPDGIDYDPTDAKQAAEILSGPLATYVAWAVSVGAPPMRITAGNGGTAVAGDEGGATAGHEGTAIAGDDGTAVVGSYGTASAGDGGKATAGYRGTATVGFQGTAIAGRFGAAIAGYKGTAIVGDGGTATVELEGTAQAGDGGTLVFEWFDGSRYRIAVGYVGENGIKANTPYCVVDGRLVEVTDAE